MLVLTSNGLSSKKLQREIKPFINGQKAALVVTADNEYKEKNYHVERLSSELRLLGAEVDIYDFDCRQPSELQEYSVVEMIGGNPFYLLHSIQTHGFAEILQQIAKDKCLVGCSAGSFVMTKSLELVNVYSPEMNIVGMKDLTALSLTDIEVLPHYSRFSKRIPAFEDNCVVYEKTYNTTVIRLNDGDAVIVANGKTTIVTAD